jgi:hypothetical protein
MMRKLTLAAAGLALGLAVPAIAGNWTIAIPGQATPVAKSGIKVVPKTAWNRSKHRPGPKAEVWTQDGLSLNQLSFFGGIVAGEALYKANNKKEAPLPKFDPKMTAPDIVQLFEASNRILLKTSLFEVEKVEPATLAGHKGVSFTYTYVVQDEEVRRRGEARAAVIGGKLYLISFAAPAIHYYDAGLGEARAIMDGARI